ncbi:MAG: hypothetical protein RXR08_13780 [Sulfolobaceae archaeon]
MLWKLVKLLVLSRVGKPTLVLLVALGILTSLPLLLFHYNKETSLTYSYYGIFYIIFLTLLPLFAPQKGSSILGIIKSDVDFLFQLPIDSKELALGLIISNIIVSLIFMVAINTLFIPSLGLLAFPTLFLISLIPPSLSVITYSLPLKSRISITFLIVLWDASALMGNPFSPLSMFFGYYEGYFLLALLDVLLLYLAITRFNTVGLASHYFAPEEKEVMKSISFSTSTPFMVMLIKNLHFLEIGGRGNILTAQTFIVRRVDVRWLILVFTIIGVVFLILLKIIYSPVVNPTVINTTYFTIIASSILIPYMVMFFFVISAFAIEPLWLYLSIMTPLELARNYISSKIIAIEVVLLPYIILIGIAEGPIVAMDLLIGIPLSIIFMISTSARIYPVNLAQGRVNMTPSSILFGFNFFIPLLAIMAGAFGVTFGVISLLVIYLVFLAIISLPFMFSEGYWKKTFEMYITMI